MGDLHMIPPGVKRVLRHYDAMQLKSRKAKLKRVQARYDKALLANDPDALLAALHKMVEIERAHHRS